MALNWLLMSEEALMFQTASPLILKHFAISHDCCRYAFGHVTWADVVTL